MKITVGTRGSKLSLIQTKTVIQQLKTAFPDLAVEMKVIKTTGDRVARKPLPLIKAKGIFEKEIDRAVLNGRVDFAVHSMKDVPTIQPPGTLIVAVPKRVSPYDVLVSKDNMKLKELPPGAVVGTCSPRRKAQVNHLRPDLKVEPIRGNVDTRISKLKEGLIDAVVLAEAGLQRLKMQGCITERLPPKDFTPAPGQGALAVIAREDNTDAINLLKRVNHPSSMAETLAERTFIRELWGGCQVPVGALGRTNWPILTLYASILSPNGKVKMNVSQGGDIRSPEWLGMRVAHRIRHQAGGLIEQWRENYEKG